MSVRTAPWCTLSKIDEWESPFQHKEVFQVLQGVQEWYPTGSYYICSPQVKDTDKDFVVLVDDMTAAHDALELAGYKWSSDESYSTGESDALNSGFSFACFRKDSTNLIVTSTKDLYMLWKEATELAKAMRLNDKEQRIRLFQYVLYGNTKLKGE